MITQATRQLLFPKTAATLRRSNLVKFAKKTWHAYKKLKEAHKISFHFSQFLAPVIANSQSKKQCVFGLRHDVYCEELNFEPVTEDKQEIDEFDSFSEFCLIQHINSEAFAGTVRVVSPMQENELLPIEKYCMDTITDKNFSPTNFKRTEICEISRLAVPSAFRRRKSDQFIGAATGNINKYIYSETELRCFPFIAVGLYLSAAALAIKLKKKHAFVMMEPRLAKSMSYVGIKFKQIGPVVDYHGKRAPYYINAALLNANLSKGFKVMLSNIQKNINAQKIIE